MEALEQTFEQGYHADKVVERILKSNKKWGARDRAFIAESTYEIIRWWRYLWELYGKTPSLHRKELYRVFGVWWQLKGKELPAWPPFERVQNFDVKKAQASMPQDVGVQQSFPIWIDEIGQATFGKKWEQIAKDLNSEAGVIIRANTHKTQRKELQKKLHEEGIDTLLVANTPDGLVFKERSNFFRNESFQKGWFEVQDGGSQQIAPFLEVTPGMRVIDACAGAGGKTLHLSALMQNKGVIIAMDVEERKLTELKRRAKRNGAHNIEIKAIEGSKTVKRLKNTADRLLLDVPCSGLGVIKRNPDSKWKLSPEKLEELIELQQQILHQYSAMLKVGGKMVYATCSILPAENEEQVALFLSTHPDFNLEAEDNLLPADTNDGFYMARLVKNG